MVLSIIYITIFVFIVFHMACFNSIFGISDLVYLKTDPIQGEWMVLQVRFCVDGTSYFLARGAETYWAYEIEMSKEKDLVKALV